MLVRFVAGVICALTLTVFPSGAQADIYPAEVTRPAGTPRGVMLVVHGGAWIMTGQGAVASMRADARRLAARGWEVHNIDYRPGADALGDVLAAHDALRARYPRMPMCVYGTSAGGHLALMTAVLRGPSVHCVIAGAAPTDLVGFPRTLAVGQVIDREIAPRFAPATWSPALQAQRIRARVLLVHARHDEVVPYAQSAAMRRALPGAQLIALGAGSRPWVHVNVSARDLRGFHDRERQLMRWAQRARR